MLSFTTRGNFIDFKYTEDVIPYQAHNVITLHKTSKCITWGFGENATNIDFKIDDITYNEIPITSIYFDGVVMSAQADFKTKIEAMFPGLAGGGGGSSYLVYKVLVGQTATDAPVANILQNTFESVTWSRDGVGGYRGTWTTPVDFDKIFILNGSVYEGDSSIIISLSNGSSIVGYMMIALNNSTSIGVSITDASFAAAEWSTILGDTRLPISFEIYP